MARVTVEDCLDKVKNRFELVHLVVERVKQLRKGAEPMVVCKNKEIVAALREIAAGKVSFDNIDQLGKAAEENRIFQALQADTLGTEGS